MVLKLKYIEIVSEPIDATFSLVVVRIFRNVFA